MYGLDGAYPGDATETFLRALRDALGPDKLQHVAYPTPLPIPARGTAVSVSKSSSSSSSSVGEQWGARKHHSAKVSSASCRDFFRFGQATWRCVSHARPAVDKR